MAEEDTRRGSDSKPSKGTEEKASAHSSPSKKLVQFIVIGAVLVLLGGGAFAGWKFFLAKKSSPEDDPGMTETEIASESDDTSPGVMYSMNPFIVNLVGHQGQRYLKTKIELEITHKDEQENIRLRSPQLRDAILLLLSSKSYQDINTPEGKIQLRSELIARINQILQEGGIRSLYFTEFVVQ
jgi:flagellar FliL protein